MSNQPLESPALADTLHAGDTVVELAPTPSEGSSGVLISASDSGVDTGLSETPLLTESVTTPIAPILAGNTAAAALYEQSPQGNRVYTYDSDEDEMPTFTGGIPRGRPKNPVEGRKPPANLGLGSRSTSSDKRDDRSKPANYPSPNQSSLSKYPTGDKKATKN